MAPAPDDYDRPWKDAVARYFPACMAFYFPPAHRQIGLRPRLADATSAELDDWASKLFSATSLDDVFTRS